MNETKTTEIYTKGELRAKAEVALMGVVTPVRDKDNIIFMLNYIAKVIGHEEQTGEEVYNEAMRYINPKKDMIVGLSCSTLLGSMKCVNIIFKGVKSKTFKLDYANGVLTHVHNYDWPDGSELGYSYFEKKANNMYHRIG